jgi:hypothetical protein
VYILVEQVSVSVTGGDVPQVIKTRRLDNGSPDVVEGVLDRPISFGETSTFTFDDGVATNVVSYTYSSEGACCFGDGVRVEDIGCIAQGGSFASGASCEEARACCFNDGACLSLAPICCELADGAPLSPETSCEGDLDGDTVDAVCGDGCPVDSLKLEPGLCACGVADDDTVADCNDQCAGRDDTRDFDNNNIPDCTEFFPIPTVSAWGLVALTLSLAIGAKIAFRRRSRCIFHPTRR